MEDGENIGIGHRTLPLKKFGCVGIRGRVLCPVPMFSPSSLHFYLDVTFTWANLGCGIANVLVHTVTKVKVQFVFIWEGDEKILAIVENKI